MFSIKGKDSALAPITRAVQPTSPRRIINGSFAPSIISSDVIMTGTLAAKGDVQIEGRFDGDVRCVGLVIGDSGHVNGNIFAEHVTIRGHVKGRIKARNVILCSASRVEGDILNEVFAVEVGAIFEGNCRHCNNPLAEAPNKVAEFYTTLEAFAATIPHTPAPDGLDFRLCLNAN